MKPIFYISLLFSSTFLIAQDQTNCEQLAIQFNEIVQTEKSKQLSFDISNMLYTGNLYYYPGLVLLNEKGDTIAKEIGGYYGIGPNFQTHLLDIKSKISFPFKGELLLYGSYYQKLFCRFPFEILSAKTVTASEPKIPSLIVATNIADDHILVDLGELLVNPVSLEYFINVTNEKGQVVFDTSTELDHFAISTESLGGKGYYYISIWDNIRKYLLPVQVVSL